MADGSVRMFSYDIAEEPVGKTTLLEALVSRSGTEVFSFEN
jgi:hypothetical protein